MHLLRHTLPALERRADLTTIVVGVGSPFGDDRVGWEVVSALQTQPWWREPVARGVRAQLCDRPGAALTDLLRAVQRAIIVDAVQAAAIAAGQISWVPARRLMSVRSSSSHGFGVAEALALADALGDLPEQVELLTIGAERLWGEELSAPVRAAVPRAVQAIRIALCTHAAFPACDGT